MCRILAVRWRGLYLTQVSGRVTNYVSYLCDRFLVRAGYEIAVLPPTPRSMCGACTWRHPNGRTGFSIRVFCAGQTDARVAARRLCAVTGFAEQHVSPRPPHDKGDRHDRSSYTADAPVARRDLLLSGDLPDEGDRGDRSLPADRHAAAERGAAVGSIDHGTGAPAADDPGTDHVVPGPADEMSAAGDTLPEMCERATRTDRQARQDDRVSEATDQVPEVRDQVCRSELRRQADHLPAQADGVSSGGYEVSADAVEVYRPRVLRQADGLPSAENAVPGHPDLLPAQGHAVSADRDQVRPRVLR